MGNTCTGRPLGMEEEEEEGRAGGGRGGRNHHQQQVVDTPCHPQIFPLHDRMHNFKTPRIPYCASSPTIQSIRRKITASGDAPNNISHADDDESFMLQPPAMWGLYHHHSGTHIFTHDQLEKTMASMEWKARPARHGWRSYCYYRHSPFGPSWIVARLPYPTFLDSRTDYLDEFMADVNSALGSTCFTLRHSSFTPLVLSIDGVLEQEVTGFTLRRIAERLANKWDKSYGETMGWVHARMSFAILRATSMCLRGTRVRWRCLDFEDEEGVCVSMN